MKTIKRITMLILFLILNVNGMCDDIEEGIDCVKCLSAQKAYVTAIENSNGVTSSFRTEYNNVVDFCDKQTADYLLEYYTDNGRDGIEYNCD